MSAQCGYRYNFLPDAVSGVRWLASVPLHSQWAANWGGELQILEESGSSEGDG